MKYYGRIKHFFDRNSIQITIFLVYFLSEIRDSTTSSDSSNFELVENRTSQTINQSQLDCFIRILGLSKNYSYAAAKL